MGKYITYATRYGTCEKYAARIAKEKNYPIYPINEIANHIADHDEIIFVTPIYTGKIFSFDKLIKELHQKNSVKLIMIIVGMYNPNRESNNTKIENIANEMLEKSTLQLQSIYHLFGELNSEKLSIIHRTLIKMLYNKAKKQAEINLSENEKDIINAYENNNQMDNNEFIEMMRSL
ncbi:DNA-directed RNA polymerase I [Listeria weihenstephanensis]|uniref:DNA-directed RNA polymerase I n=1 Tax=Listeria weihenstephanensis TaxID=1006155 RepID=A0A841ZA68_9LIST|nr:flavodoxin domain-containing protein [Listeria weihenstephanensis]MBC1502060.1 DNA-directed RNA polymerase I [Listeria weihenstephanensis]